jgi:hypothetical protein
MVRLLFSLVPLPFCWRWQQSAAGAGRPDSRDAESKPDASVRAVPASGKTASLMSLPEMSASQPLSLQNCRGKAKK